MKKILCASIAVFAVSACGQGVEPLEPQTATRESALISGAYQGATSVVYTPTDPNYAAECRRLYEICMMWTWDSFYCGGQYSGCMARGGRP